MRIPSIITHIILIIIAFCNITFAQEARIDNQYQITIDKFSDDNAYTIELASASFASRSTAEDVFQYYSRHPLLQFDLDYDNSTVTMKVETGSPNSLNRAYTLEDINAMLARRSMAYARNN